MPYFRTTSFKLVQPFVNHSYVNTNISRCLICVIYHSVLDAVLELLNVNHNSNASVYKCLIISYVNHNSANKCLIYI